MKPALASFGILAAILISGAALAADAGDDAGTDAAAGAAGAGGAAGSAGAAGAAGSAGMPNEITCGAKTCTGWSLGGFVTIPPCCTGPQDQKCGAFVSEDLASYGIPAGCHETEQVGATGCGCPPLPITTPLGGIDLPGCCREASSTCGAVADLSQYGGPNMGCIDSSMVDGGTSQSCDYATCGGTAGTAGTTGTGGAGATAGTGGAAGKSGASGSGGVATDGGAGSSGADEEDDGGCGCRVPAGSDPVGAWLAALALLGAVGLRRRSR